MTTVTSILKYDLSDAIGVVGQQPYKIKAKFDHIIDWQYTDKLNELTLFKFTVPNDEFGRANGLLERMAYVSFIKPFRGITCVKSQDETQINMEACEFAFHLTRRIFRKNTNARIIYGTPELYLTFEGDVLDHSGKNHDGTVTGTVVFDFGALGQAAKFDGSSYITIADESTFDFEFNNKFSVVFYVKPASISAAQGLVVKSGGLTTEIGWKISMNASGEIEFGLCDSSTNFVINSTALTIDKFVQVTCTYDGSGNEDGMDIYIDSVLDNNNKTTNNITSTILNDLAVTIGADSDGDADVVADTIIDDVRIYKRLLTLTMVQDLFKQRTDIVESNQLETAFTADVISQDILTAANLDMPEGVTWTLSPAFPTTEVIVEFNFENHWEALQTIARALGKDLFFDNQSHTVFIETKGKILGLDAGLDVTVTSKPEISTDDFANDINLLGKSTTTGEQLEDRVQTTSVLRYNYERVVSDNKLNTKDQLRGIGNALLSEFQKLTPQVKGTIPYNQFVRFSLESGDIIELSQPEKQLTGAFRVMDIKVSQKNVKISLERADTAIVRIRSLSLTDIIGGILKRLETQSIET